MMSDESSWNPC